MSDEPKLTSERARKRAAGKIRREVSIRRRETYFDLLVSGYSVEQIASHTQKSPATVRRALGQALAKRRPDAPEDYYARIQVARLTKALRCADASLEEGDLKAIVPLLKVVRELNLYHGLNVDVPRPEPAALPEIAPTSPPLALTHAAGVGVAEALAEGERSCTKAHLNH